jgi:3'-5' exoribonuclease
MKAGESLPEPTDATAFCGSVPWTLIEALADGDDVRACYVVRESRKLQTKSNQDYLRLVLGDRSGTIEGVIWEDVDTWAGVCLVKAIVGVRGRVSFYQNRPQLRINAVVPIRASASDLSLLLQCSPRDRGQMEKELDELIGSVRERPLSALLRRCLGADTESGSAFRQHPAATRNHHAYVSGLLEHTLSVATACGRLAEHYEAQGVELDRDLLITGALLHDIGKVQELEGPPAPAYTTEGRLLGHIVLGMQLVERQGREVSGLTPDRLLLVQHLIASHQGKPEWDSPRVPQTLEALVLHYADDLDAKMNQAKAALNGVPAGAWSEYERALGRSFFRPDPQRSGIPVRSSDSAEDVIDLFRE